MGYFVMCVQSRKGCIDLMHGDDGEEGTKFELHLAEWLEGGCVYEGRVCDGG